MPTLTTASDRERLFAQYAQPEDMPVAAGLRALLAMSVRLVAPRDARHYAEVLFAGKWRTLCLTGLRDDDVATNQALESACKTAMEIKSAYFDVLATRGYGLRISETHVAVIDRLEWTRIKLE
jgi:hypothetical protein